MNETTKAKGGRPRGAPAGERAVRVPEELLARAEALIPLLTATPWGDAIRWSETAVVRLALSRGLKQLAEELAEMGSSKPAAVRKAKG